MEKSLKGLSIDIIVNACYTPKTNINFNLSNQKKIFWLFVLNKMCLFKAVLTLWEPDSGPHKVKTVFVCLWEHFVTTKLYKTFSKHAHLMAIKLQFFFLKEAKTSFPFGDFKCQIFQSLWGTFVPHCHHDITSMSSTQISWLI